MIRPGDVQIPHNAINEDIVDGRCWPADDLCDRGPRARYRALADELFALELMYSWDSEEMDVHLDRMDVEWDAMTADERASMELDPRVNSPFFQEQQLWSSSFLAY